MISRSLGSVGWIVPATEELEHGDVVIEEATLAFGEAVGPLGGSEREQLGAEGRERLLLLVGQAPHVARARVALADGEIALGDRCHGCRRLCGWVWWVTEGRESDCGGGPEQRQRQRGRQATDGWRSMAGAIPRRCCWYSWSGVRGSECVPKVPVASLDDWGVDA